MKCFTCVALRILNGDASLRILSTNASGCYIEYRIPFMIWKLQTTFFKSIFNESVWISITISLKFIPKGPIDYKSVLVQVMAWHRTGEKPLPESMLTQFTDAYIRHWGEIKLPSQEDLSLGFGTSCSVCFPSSEFTENIPYCIWNAACRCQVITNIDSRLLPSTPEQIHRI